jgi:acyl-coenzyme A thioesterase 9
MDFMAGRVAYTHCYSIHHETRDITMVTAACDHLEFYPNQLDLNENLTVECYLTMTGTSSVETRIDVLNSERKIYCSAFYVMVARDKVTHKARRVPKLIPESDAVNPKAKLRYEMGKNRQKGRKSQRLNSVFSAPPNSDESKILHNMFLKEMTKDHEDENNESQFGLPMIKTRVEKTILKHSQDRNIHGKIFGGLLMRESLELAYVCAYMHGAGEQPTVYHIDDIQFILPVDVGSVITYTAHLTYVHERIANVKVDVQKVVKE